MILLKKLMPLTRKGEVLILKETVAKEKGHHGQGTTLRIIQGIEEALILKETCFLILFKFIERKDQTMDNKIIVFTME